MSVQTTCGFAGASWVQSGYPKDMSPLGKNVANLLGQLFHGIYHISAAVRRTDWSDEHSIIISVPTNELATIDFNGLTRLVFLAHLFCLRVQIDGSAPHLVCLLFHQRSRDGGFSEVHPTLQDAVDAFMAQEGYLEVHPAREEVFTV